MRRREQVGVASEDDPQPTETDRAVKTGICPANVASDYVVVVDSSRRYVEVSPSFCKLLGYSEEELIGKSYDHFTAPRTNDIPVVLDLFIRAGYMHGIWIFLHRTGAKIIVRYEAFIRPDGLYEGHMELIGAGA
jgi:PAS domain S-box-containing protein